MLGGRQMNMDDYWAIVRRRRWLILIPIILAPAVALLIARKLPPKYTSTSLILVEEPKVPTSFVPSMLSNDLTTRLAHMEEQILSRARMEPIIEQFGLYKSDWNSESMDDLVDRVRGAVVVTPVAYSNQPPSEPSEEGEGHRAPGYRVQFTADTPSLAQAVCNQITSMLIDANLRLGEQRAEGTATFLAGQLQEAKQKLQEQDAKLATFQRQYFGSLPDQEQSTIQMVGSLSGQFNSLTDTLNRDEEEKTYLESVLSQQMAAWKASQNGKSPLTLEQQLAQMENQLSSMRLQYTDTYPDVIRMKEAIAELKKKIAHQPKTRGLEGKSAGLASEPGEIAQLQGQLHSLNMSIQIAEVDQARVRRQLSAYEGNLKLTPAVEQQYKDLTRDYETALKFYDSLLEKEDESRMATSLQQQQGGENMEVLDPADLPTEPSFPNYERFAGGGVMVGIILGMGIALLLEMRDKALRDERDIEFFLELPTLALVPSLLNNPKKLRGASKRLGKQPVIASAAKQTQE